MDATACAMLHLSLWGYPYGLILAVSKVVVGRGRVGACGSFHCSSRCQAYHSIGTYRMDPAAMGWDFVVQQGVLSAIA
jgi:hypothetical protein